jgi:cytoskeletal protein RodZ
MATQLADFPNSPAPTKPTREQALAIAERRKAARRTRTRRIRRAIAVIGVAAFIGPFAVIFTQLASGHDPALASNNTKAVASAASSSSGSTSGSSGSSSTGSTSSGSGSTGSTSSGSTSSGSTATQSTQTTSSSTPSTVTTQQS